MKSAYLAAALCLVVACSLSPNGSSSTSSPSGAASGQLDAQVQVPPAFPRDIPVYPGARLTAAAGFPSAGLTSWGMEWETFDAVPKVQAYYAQGLNKGDWSITFTTSVTDAFAAAFMRRSNSHVNGTLAASRSGGVTKILMSLLAPPA